jgi:hypothetical protein
LNIELRLPSAMPAFVSSIERLAALDSHTAPAGC